MACGCTHASEAKIGSAWLFDHSTAAILDCLPDLALTASGGDYAGLANRLADAARAAILPLFRTDVAQRTKADGTPVTAADVAAEQAMRDILAKEAPSHAVWGEEGERQDGEWLWVLDPIEGTRSFISGCPLFTVLICLLRDGEPVLGVIDAPALDERWSGNGSSATLTVGGRSKPCRVSHAPELASATCATTLPPMDEEGARLDRAVGSNRYGGDAYNFASVAAGWMHLAFDQYMQPYDYLAVIPIVEGAGGFVAEFSGRRPSIGGDRSAIAAASRELLDEALEAAHG